MDYDDLYPGLLAVVSEIGARPDIPIESEAFFSDIVKNFQGSREQCLAYIRSHLREWFRCVSGPPAWIQDADWPFWEGRPMVFVGQINVPASAGWLHDDAAFYTFWDPQSGVTETVVQVY